MENKKNKYILEYINPNPVINRIFIHKVDEEGYILEYNIAQFEQRDYEHYAKMFCDYLNSAHK